MPITPNKPGPTKRGGLSRILTLTLVAFAGLLVAVGAGIWHSGGNAVPDIGGPFKLTAGDSKTVTDADFRGRFMLIYFGYTFCPDVCPTTLQEVSSALDRMGSKADRVQPIFITVDPKRDTPEVIGQYVKAFSPRLIGLTGTPAELAPVEKEFRVYAAPSPSTAKGADKDDYTVDHSSILYLIGPDGKSLAFFRADLPAEKLATELGRYVD